MAVMIRNFWIHRGMVHAKWGGICNVRVTNAVAQSAPSNAFGADLPGVEHEQKASTA